MSDIKQNSDKRSKSSKKSNAKSIQNKKTGVKKVTAKTKTKVKGEKITLVIVESPAKAKTINKYLGKGYLVKASMGHIIDLPKSRIGVRVEDGFEADYITVRGKGSILNELKKVSAGAEKILLASDNDREGEAIAFHIKEVLAQKNPGKEIKRIIFNEITKNAILDSIKNAREIDEKMVNAQKTRRILDRLVGYNISPILWSKVKRGLSAGRVQSVTLKVICEREAEIEKFIPEEYWTLAVKLFKNKKIFKTELSRVSGSKPELKNKKSIDSLMELLNKGEFIVDAINESTKSYKSIPPFTTSKLQQTASNRLSFTTTKTMQIAQQLYEGIGVGKETIGLITYMRTDSTRISSQAIDEVRRYIDSEFPNYLPETPLFYSKSQAVQDAHEAIRPTSVYRTPDSVKQYLTPDQFKIYSIIWERFVASQMSNAEYLTKTIVILNSDCEFKISDSKLISEGYIAVLNLLKSKEDDAKIQLPDLTVGEKLLLKEFVPEQHFTQPPPRYNDASIVKFLEENGIGRPSTYAPTISTLLTRYYVTRKTKQIQPTVLGKLVNEIITKSFSDIVNIEFTANMENSLDEIASGNNDSFTVLNGFYEPFKKQLDIASATLEDHKKSFDEETDEICEKCGGMMVKKLGKYGFFLACSKFPECKNSKTIPLADCPEDGCTGKIVAKRKSGKKKEFYGCTKYPECSFVSWYKPTEYKCPKCTKYLIEKSDKNLGSYKVCVDEKCGYKMLKENTEL